MIIQVIKFKTVLPEEEVIAVARKREADFKALPGLIQKYYVKTSNPGEFGGIYVWDSEASLNAYRGSALAASIPEAYEISGPPDVETLDLLFKLRD